MTVKTSRFCHSYLYMYLFRTHYLFNLGNIFIVIYLVLMYSMLSSYVYLHVLIYLCMICMSLLGCLAHVTHAFTTEVGTDSIRGSNSPLARKKKREESDSRGEEYVVNYLCWQMFTDPNMHRSVDLAVPYSCKATFVFFFLSFLHDACRSSCYSGCFTASIHLSCHHF